MGVCTYTINEYRYGSGCIYYHSGYLGQNLNFCKLSLEYFDSSIFLLFSIADAALVLQQQTTDSILDFTCQVLNKECLAKSKFNAT